LVDLFPVEVIETPPLGPSAEGPPAVVDRISDRIRTVRQVAVEPDRNSAAEAGPEPVSYVPGPIVPGEATPFVVSRDGNEGLEPAPLPASWIRSGNPQPRMRFTAMATDGSTASGIWTCGPGVFTFIYDFDEWVHVIGGSVLVEAGAFSRRLRAGSVAFFPRGLTTVWHVDDHVHKFFVQKNPPRALRIVRKLLGRNSPFR
jgi:uncharacterized cupin superfamily protein